MDNRAHILAVIGICFGVAIGGLIFSELNLTIAEMKYALGASLGQMQWVINIYGIIVCSTLVIFGRLGDMFGRKWLYVSALVLLAVAMTGTGWAHSISWVIFFQALNGLSSSMVMPLSQALITNVFDDDKKSQALGLWSASIGIALAVGPTYAGLVIHLISWRWVFLLNVPIILLSALLVTMFCPNSKSDEQRVYVDGWGSLFLALTMAAVVMALVQLECWPTPIIVALLGFAVLCFIVLLRVERRAQQPIIRKDLFANRAFVLSALSNSLLLVFIWSGLFLIPLYLQNVFGYTAENTGLILSLVTTPVIVLAFFNHRLYHYFGCKNLIRVGFISLSIASILFLTFSVTVPLIIVLLAALAFGIAWGLIWPPSATKALSTLPRQHAGAASGTFVTFQEVGGTLGLAVTGAVVRFNADFSKGFKHGMWVLLVISMIGFCITLAMKHTVGGDVNS